MSLIAWLDTSPDDERRMRELVRMFSDPGTLDDLGIGQVRDAFGDRLFPGSSTLHTRARYLLFVPWIFQQAARTASGRSLLTKAQNAERRLIVTLKDVGAIDGLIGRVAGEQVKTLPSTIYWARRCADTASCVSIEHPTSCVRSTAGRRSTKTATNRLHIYVCSNIDLARQNVNWLNVVGSTVPMSTRLSLLATNSSVLDEGVTVAGKPVNRVSLTPRTSFEKGWRTGTVDERALLMTILDDRLGFDRSERTAAYRILQGTVKNWKRFRDHVERFQAEHAEKLDQQIVTRFARSARRAGIDTTSPLHRFKMLVADTVGKSSVPGGPEVAANLVGELRALLAHAGVDAREPDLVILDEFQRFSDLLDENREVGELAHALFNYEQARVLLLSATPYPAFTTLEQGSEGESHLGQFRLTIDFLVRGSADTATTARIEKLLDEYRSDITSGREPVERSHELRGELLQIMCRTEHPVAITHAMVTERQASAASVSPGDIGQYLDLYGLAQHLDTQIPLEVWKSVPHLVHFMDAYQLGRKAHTSVAEGVDATAIECLSRMARIDPAAVERFDVIPSGNARLDTLLGETTGEGWQRMLRLPPSLPYSVPAGAYRDPNLAGMTKKLVFSSWSATPTAVGRS